MSSPKFLRSNGIQDVLQVSERRRERERRSEREKEERREWDRETETEHLGVQMMWLLTSVFLRLAEAGLSPCGGSGVCLTSARLHMKGTLLVSLGFWPFHMPHFFDFFIWIFKESKLPTCVHSMAMALPHFSYLSLFSNILTRFVLKDNHHSLQYSLMTTNENSSINSSMSKWEGNPDLTGGGSWSWLGLKPSDLSANRLGLNQGHLTTACGKQSPPDDSDMSGHSFIEHGS